MVLCIISSTLIYVNISLLRSQEVNRILNENNSEIKPRINELKNVNKIHIDDTSPLKNWAITEAAYDWCTGSGNITDPYVIENVIIDGNNSDSCIIIEYSSVNFIIRGCTIFNAANGGGALHYGIYLYYVHNAKILHNDCFDNGNVGICFQGIGSNNVISYNTVYNNHRAGINLESFNDNCIISNNIVYDNGQDGIVLRQDCDDNIIRDNNVYNCGYAGILLQGGSDYNIVKDNRVSDSMRGLWIYGDSNDNTIIRNTFSSNDQSGVHIEESQRNIIKNNIIENNKGPGIIFDSWIIEENTLNIITENLIKGNLGNSVTIDQYCFNNLLYMNCFINNDLPPLDGGTEDSQFKLGCFKWF